MQTPEEVRAAYDAAARQYAERFSDELEHKPLDRELLRRFAAMIPAGGVVHDLGCGPGQTTAFLHDRGVDVRGMDLSPGLLREARRRHPGIPFEEGNLLALPIADGSAAGILAFYCIVHLSTEQLRRAFGEMHRALRPGGRLLLSFHVGDEVVHAEDFLGSDRSLDFAFFAPDDIAAGLRDAGFGEIEVVQRDPYPEVEYPSRRAYLFVRKPPTETPTR